MPSRRSGCTYYIPPFLIIVLVASLLAVGIFLGIPFIQGQPEFPRGTFPIVVEGNWVVVASDPNQEVFLIPLPDAGTGGQIIVEIPTATPVILPTEGPTPTIPVLLTIAPTPIPPRDCVTFTNYVVQSGDTLFSISNRYVTSIPLMARYGISSTSLVPGNTIRLPIGDPACCPAGWRPYAVIEGESWFSIAQKCGVTVDTLLQGNGLPAGSPLYMASIICVPQN
ncbi:MAG: LysM peptidoglycan-binding domain-containing protein [Chloroflexota bacterium]|jgi:LysM repeat protein